ncbi:MAG: 3-oxoacyl-[acyl-carrier protein] reductase [Mucilaginibacter sp.]|nr:3-oxoacyl-[acyl-carrier protein] reductase [Mucilaginibacter sp.]
MKHNVLVFGGNSFLSKAFNKKYGRDYIITNVYRNLPSGDLNFDFENDDAESIAPKLNGPYKAILFFQGINPLVGVKDITEDHFIKMLKINLVTPTLLVRSLAGKLNKGALILFVSSVAKKKGSYDPAYASSKAGLTGLMYSLANAYPDFRFNIISLGLVEGSPVFNNMTPDFRQKHADRMFNNSFIKVEDVITVVDELIINQSINRTDIEIDGGYN